MHQFPFIHSEGNCSYFIDKLIFGSLCRREYLLDQSICGFFSYLNIEHSDNKLTLHAQNPILHCYRASKRKIVVFQDKNHLNAALQKRVFVRTEHLMAFFTSMHKVIKWLLSSSGFTHLQTAVHQRFLVRTDPSTIFSHLSGDYFVN